MHFKSLSTTVFGLALLLTPTVVPAFAQEQANPTTSQEEVRPSTQESTPSAEEANPTTSTPESTPTEEANPTTSQEEATPSTSESKPSAEEANPTTSTQEENTPSYDQGEESTPGEEETTPTPEQIETRSSTTQIDYIRLEPTPKKESINQGLTSPSPQYMKAVLGVPGALTENCSPVTNSHLSKLIVTEDVGPFKVRGLKPAVGALKRIFGTVKQKNPELYSQLRTAGMLCVRKVRGGSNFSNHSWGIAIDIKIKQKLDKRGDNKTQRGLKALYPYFHQENFYWGAAFPTEDSMHFEASKQLIAKWKREGRI
ncbi:MAG: M15 family metallopeptidase [Calothrix sp. FI2-JRJ7]|jgi:hypothetical protein|nr:M15 family metallopeptidase [Calothrix sp. FI2-JRJ7]